MAVIIDHSKNGAKANHRIMTSTTTTSTAPPALPIYSHEVGKDLIPELLYVFIVHTLIHSERPYQTPLMRKARRLHYLYQMTRLS